MLGKKYIAKRYAAALLSIAAKDNAAQVVLDDLLTLKKAISEHPYHKHLLYSRSFPTKIKHELLNPIIETNNVNKLVINLLHLLTRHNRMWCFDEIYNHYAHLMLEHKGEIHLVVESMELLSDNECKEISSTLSKNSGKTMVITSIINKQLLGGLVFKLNYKMLDCSLRNKLQKIGSALLSAPVKT